MSYASLVLLWHLSWFIFAVAIVLEKRKGEWDGRLRISVTSIFLSILFLGPVLLLASICVDYIWVATKRCDIWLEECGGC